MYAKSHLKSTCECRKEDAVKADKYFYNNYKMIISP